MKSRSWSEFGSKLNYSIIPRTTSPSLHTDDNDDDNDDDDDVGDDDGNNDEARKGTMDSIGFHLQRFIRRAHFLRRSLHSVQWARRSSVQGQS